MIRTVGCREVAPNGEAGQRDGDGKPALAKTGGATQLMDEGCRHTDWVVHGRAELRRHSSS